VNIKNIQKVLLECYSKDLCYPKVQCDWNENNRCFGMCAITSLIINDYFGGDICKIYVDGISHYFNLIENNIVDLTKDQFNREMDYKDYKIMDREKILTDDTKNRYVTLKARLINKLLRQVDKKVYSCKSCDKLVDKFPDDVTVFLGKDNDIVLVGEAPANNGWRKSHKLWIDLNGKVLPSGLVLQKLFDIIDRNIFETTFLESVKCYPLERKNLKTCSSNCKNIMLEQLKILNPKLIITLGEFPTRNLLDFKFNKFADVVGKIYEVNDYKLLPIYHPSPISPKSYTGNIPIFEKLRNM
jgi:uracil-DNA glycosylase family 4